MIAGLRLDELAADADSIPRLPHGALKHIADAEFAPDLLYIHSAALVGKARIAGDDEQPFDAREASDNLLDDAVGEIVLLGIAAHIGEGQDGDRGLVGKRERRWRYRCRSGQPDTIDPNRPSNVF